MRNKNLFRTLLNLLGLMAVACQPSSNVTTNTRPASSSALAPANMTRVGTIDDRYQSYNVEMLEVTGGKSVQLNSSELKLSAGDELPVLTGTATPAGNVEFAPTTITFIALPQAGNGACR
jgi:hypothetical protein